MGLSLKQSLQKVQKLQRESSLPVFWVHVCRKDGKLDYVIVTVSKEENGGFVDFNFYDFEKPKKRERTFQNLVDYINDLTDFKGF